MKIILFASALALSTAAIAQDATAPATPPATPDASMPAAAPAPDASAPAPAAPDASMTPAPATGGAVDATAAASSTDDSNLPKCSKTVTDKCVQGGKGGTAHKAMHHKKK